MKVVIDGVKYVQAIVDCDNRDMSVGDEVYVRHSCLKNYKNVSMSNRNGVLIEASGNEFFVQMYNEEEPQVFPVEVIRRA
jgi:hypothetical protein